MTKNKLIYTLNVFPTVSSVDSWFSRWCTSTNQGIWPSLDEAFEAGQKHIKETADLKVYVSAFSPR